MGSSFYSKFQGNHNLQKVGTKGGYVSIKMLLVTPKAKCINNYKIKTKEKINLIRDLYDVEEKYTGRYVVSNSLNKIKDKPS